ncbi:MAG TPA: GAF domain-containing SpoIIE family protein phosphatase [Methylomirabilota bacterium]|jgi:sigma-B regulation protein RsbU (phosphoserine phosphatase)|nr:GAF domain-containing SpoIIE family protein phosphatase [Methylomirabilota bacterium]
MTQVPPTPSTPDALPQGELEFITELCAVVAEQSELQPILDWLVHKSTRLMGADECTIKLLTAGGDTAKTIIFDSRRSGIEAGSRSWAPAIKASVMGFLLSQPGELASPDLLADARFPGLKSLQTPVRALLALPLKVDGRVTGMIAVSSAQPGRQWTRHDVQLMSIVATHSASVIEKARLRVEAEEKRRLELEREAMEKDLRIARDIQMRLVPAEPLALGPWRAEGRLVPAKQVGGDLYDYFALDAQRAAVLIADVSGKGVPASLLVSTVASTVRAFADGQLSPKKLVEQVNRATVRSSAAGKFVTFFYAELDHAQGRLHYVNAGHNFPRLRRASGEVLSLETGGTPLGLFEGLPYEQGEQPFAGGDALLLFSDGISEAVDGFNQEYGEDRLEALWKQHGAGPTAQTLDLVYDDVIRFRGSAPQNDDMTMVVVSPAAGA